MVPLIIFSFLTWGLIFERVFRYWNLKNHLESFQLKILNALLKREFDNVRRLCESERHLPTATIFLFALERLSSLKNQKGDSNAVTAPMSQITPVTPANREKLVNAVHRKRALVNTDLKKGLWILGTIGSASPFVGLFGTVVGILQSFFAIAKTGQGGFGVVAAGISEALVATASGIIVAVIAVIAFNSFQHYVGNFALLIRLQTEEFLEMLESEGTDVV